MKSQLRVQLRASAGALRPHDLRQSWLKSFLLANTAYANATFSGMTSELLYPFSHHGYILNYQRLDFPGSLEQPAHPHVHSFIVCRSL